MGIVEGRGADAHHHVRRAALRGRRSDDTSAGSRNGRALSIGHCVGQVVGSRIGFRERGGGPLQFALHGLEQYIGPRRRGKSRQRNAAEEQKTANDGAKMKLFHLNFIISRNCQSNIHARQRDRKTGMVCASVTQCVEEDPWSLPCRSYADPSRNTTATTAAASRNPASTHAVPDETRGARTPRPPNNTARQYSTSTAPRWPSPRFERRCAV